MASSIQTRFPLRFMHGSVGQHVFLLKSRTEEEKVQSQVPLGFPGSWFPSLPLVVEPPALAVHGVGWPNHASKQRAVSLWQKPPNRPAVRSTSMNVPQGHFSI